MYYRMLKTLKWFRRSIPVPLLKVLMLGSLREEGKGEARAVSLPLLDRSGSLGNGLELSESTRRKLR